MRKMNLNVPQWEKCILHLKLISAQLSCISSLIAFHPCKTFHWQTFWHFLQYCHDEFCNWLEPFDPSGPLSIYNPIKRKLKWWNWSHFGYLGHNCRHAIWLCAVSGFVCWIQKKLISSKISGWILISKILGWRNLAAKFQAGDWSAKF